jgi:hypothetical protein
MKESIGGNRELAERVKEIMERGKIEANELAIDELEREMENCMQTDWHKV